MTGPRRFLFLAVEPRTLSILLAAWLLVGQGGVVRAQGPIHETHEGDVLNGWVGWSLSSAGDIDADGFMDFLVAAPFHSVGGQEVGAVGTFSGRDGAPIRITTGSPSVGVAAVESIGDIDHDGTPDFATSGGQSGLGVVTVFSGQSGSQLFQFTGDHVNDDFGAAFAGPGDVDGDGFVDIAVGAPQAVTSAGIDSGRVRVFGGFDGSVIHTLNGATAGDNLGVAIGSCGDFDVDGRADFVMGAPGDDAAATDAGAAYVASGLSGGALASFHGVLALDSYGYSADGVGDVDGDGVCDLAARAAPNAPPTPVQYVRIDSGATGLPIHQFGGAGTSWHGEDVSRLGDLDLDGRADVLVRLRPVTPSGKEVHVMSGATGQSILAVKGVIGHSLSDAGDVNGDGLVDFLLGKAGSVGSPWAAYAYSPTCGSLATFGSACPNGAGFLPQISMLEGCATPGGEIRIRAQAVGSATNLAAVVVGGTSGSVQAHGCTFLIGPPLALTILPTSFGFGFLSLEVDTDASIGVGSVYVQVLYPEPGTPAGFAATEGIAITFE